MEAVVEQMLRRQLAAFAQFTSRPLGDQNLDMMDGCVRARAGVMVSHAKLLEYMPDRDRLLLRAGVGWKEGYVGKYEVPPDLDTPVGYAFAIGEPIAIRDYREGKAFRYPAILKDHGCVASVNVPVRTDLGIFGVLEIDHTSARDFSKDDVAFLTGLGNTIAQAIELHRALLALRSALDEQQLFVREMNHRIKNNLSLVGAMLSLQARRSSDSAVRDALSNAVQRINNLALVHDRLQLFSSSATRIAAGEHFRELCNMLKSLVPPGITLHCKCRGSLSGDCVEPLTLIVNELVTNSAKYAFPGRDKGEIVVGYQEEGAGWRLWVQGRWRWHDRERQEIFHRIRPSVDHSDGQPRKCRGDLYVGRWNLRQRLSGRSGDDHVVRRPAYGHACGQTAILPLNDFTR